MAVRDVATNRPLAALVASFGGLTLAEWAYLIALSVLALNRGGAVALGLVGLRLFWAAAGSVIGPSLLARQPSLRLMAAVTSSRAVIVGATALLAWEGTPLGWLLVLVFLDGLVSSLYRPAQAAAIPVLSRTPGEVSAAIAAMSMAKTVSQAVGALAGGLLLSLVAPPIVFAAAAAIFLASAVAPLFWSRSAGAVGDPGVSLFGRLREVATAFGDRGVANLLAVSGARTFVRGTWTAIAVIASFHLLGAGSRGVGLLMLASGLGAAVALPISTALIGRSTLSLPVALALVACGLPLALIALFPRLDAALALIAIWGLGMAVADVTTSTLLFRAVPAAVLPRATAGVEAAKLSAEGLGSLLAPLLVVALGTRTTLELAALPLPIVLLAGWRALLRTDARGIRDLALLRLLHGVAVFAPLNMETLGSLAGRARRESAPPETSIVTQGQLGDRFYVVESGRAAISIDGYPIDVVGPGQSFGERALLRQVPRMATVTSTEAMALLSWDREEFLEAVTGERGGIALVPPARARAASENFSQDERVRALSAVGALSRLESESLSGLAEVAELQRWQPGSSIIRQGEQGDRLYVLMAGRVEVKPASGSGPVTLIPGDYFGEIALLHDVPRTADVIALEAAITLSLDRQSFTNAVGAQRRIPS